MKVLSMNEYLDSYFWFRGIGCNHEKAVVLAKKECIELAKKA